MPPLALLDKPMNCVTTKFVRTSTNKFRCPIFCLAVSTSLPFMSASDRSWKAGRNELDADFIHFGCFEGFPLNLVHTPGDTNYYFWYTWKTEVCNSDWKCSHLTGKQ